MIRTKTAVKATLAVALGAATVTLAGGVVMPGGTGAGVTVSVAAALVTVPAPLVTTTSNCAPLSARAVGSSTYAALVAPAMLAPLRRH